MKLYNEGTLEEIEKLNVAQLTRVLMSGSMQMFYSNVKQNEYFEALFSETGFFNIVLEVLAKKFEQTSQVQINMAELEAL